MIFLEFILPFTYLLFPVIGYRLYKSEQSQNPADQKTSFSLKDLMRSKSNIESVKLMKWGIWACLFAFLSLVLMGLPGGLLIELYRYFHLIPSDKLQGDMMWPLAIMMSMFIPIAWPFALSIKIALSRFWNLQFKYTIVFVILIWLLLPIVWIRFIV